MAAQVVQLGHYMAAITGRAYLFRISGSRLRFRRTDPDINRDLVIRRMLRINLALPAGRQVWFRANGWSVPQLPRTLVGIFFDTTIQREILQNTHKNKVALSDYFHIFALCVHRKNIEQSLPIRITLGSFWGNKAKN